MLGHFQRRVAGLEAGTQLDQAGLVTGAALRVFFHVLHQKASRQLGLRSTRLTHPGAMVAVQRFGSALNLNIHFHALVLDGVYVLDAFGAPTFVELPQPTLEELHRLANRIAKAVLELLRRKRVWLDAEDDEDPVAERSSMLAQASMAGNPGLRSCRVPPGPAPGRPAAYRPASRTSGEVPGVCAGCGGACPSTA